MYPKRDRKSLGVGVSTREQNDVLRVFKRPQSCCVESGLDRGDGGSAEHREKALAQDGEGLLA